MSIRDFVKDPLAYSKSHIVTFYGGTSADPTYGGVGPDATGMQVLQTYDRWSGDWKAIHYGMKGGTFTEFRFQQTFDKSISAWGNSRIGKGSGDMHTVTAFASNQDAGIRFLPWSPNHVTFMSIDDAALTFFTGPLTGCAIYLAQAASGQWWGFHANRNNSADGSAVKGSMTKLTIDAAGLAVRVMHMAIYGKDYFDQGFVFGQKKKGRWSFYVCDVASKEKAGHYSSRVRQL
jgi:hypothetical protein